jgi:hypothetical protein
LELNELARSPILATCIVETTSKDAASITKNGRVVPAHATLRILRTFPQNAIRDQRINLDFEALPEGDNGMSGPALPHILQGAVLILPLKRNPDQRHLPWRLMMDQRDGLVIPAISWGAAVTLREFAQDLLLVRELTAMLKEERPGSLFVAHDMIAAGQKSLSGPAIAISLRYIKKVTAGWTELQPACSTLRDFGSDQEFERLVSEIKNTQYLDTPRYDALWRATIWPESPRAATVLQILMHDDRMYQGMRYSDLAHNELERLAKLTN